MHSFGGIIASERRQETDASLSLIWQQHLGGWYLTTSPIITADWRAKSSDRWTLPIGGGFGRVFKLGEQPVNMQLAAYYNAVTPSGGASWQIRTQIQFLFPK